MRKWILAATLLLCGALRAQQIYQFPSGPAVGIVGGSTGQMPYQSAPGVTAFKEASYYLPCSGDITAQYQAILNLTATQSVDLEIGAGTCRVVSQTTIGNDGGSPPRQKPLHIHGQTASPGNNGAAPLGGTIIDFQYVGTKMRSFGLGYIEIDHITFEDTVDGTGTFFLTTFTTPNLHDNYFFAKAARNQDAIQLGGGTTNTTDAAETSAFQGYQGHIHHNYAQNVRRFAWCRVYCNGTVIEDNAIWSGSGGDATIGAIQYTGITGAGGTIDGGEVKKNLIEVMNYVNPILVEYTTGVKFDNMFYDFGATTVNTYVLAASTNNNEIRGDAKGLVSNLGVQNTIQEIGSSGIWNIPRYVNFLSIGGTSPYAEGYAPLYVGGAGYAAYFRSASATATQAGGFVTERARGTMGSPTVVSDADTLGAWVFQGFDGSTMRQAAKITGVVNGTPGSNDMPGAVHIYTTPDGSATPVDRVAVTQSGLLIAGYGVQINVGGSANTVMCWKADGKTPGYATVAEITSGTCH